MKICFQEKKNSKEKVCYGRSWTPEIRHDLIIFITSAHEILPVDGVCSWQSLIYEEFKDIFEENKHCFDGKSCTLTHFVAFEEHMSEKAILSGIGVTCSKGSSYWSWLTIYFAMLIISLLIFRHFNQCTVWCKLNFIRNCDYAFLF